MSALFRALEPFRQRSNLLIEEAVSNLQGPARLVEACGYALSGAGKRIRPSLVLMIGGEGAGPAALCVEMLHTASLIADDLPCMDNDDERRGRPTLHVAFDEETALLASYGLIGAAYEYLSQMPHPESCQRALFEVSKAIGLGGVTSGQYKDMHLESPTEEALFELIDLKTGALFEISFVLGWLSRGREHSALDQVKSAARHFGRAFQLLDDLDDIEQDTQHGAPNGALLFGKEWAQAQIDKELASLRQLSEELGLQIL